MSATDRYEEIRSIALEVLLLSKKADPRQQPSSADELAMAVASVVDSRAGGAPPIAIRGNGLSREDDMIFLEVFHDFFRQGIITWGWDNANRNYPFFRLTRFGRQMSAQSGPPYFFHDVSSYEAIIRKRIPQIDEVTLAFAKEAMQAYLSFCTLSATVMLGVAAEDAFQRLLETMEANAKWESAGKNALAPKTFSKRIVAFKKQTEPHLKSFPSDLQEGFHTNFDAALDLIRTYRNESGHPSGKVVSREECYMLLHLFIPCCAKIHELAQFFAK